MQRESAKDRALKRRQAEDLLGPRGKLKLSSESGDDDARLVAIREWVIANHFPPWSVFEFNFFSIREVTRAYNDTSGKGLDALRKKLDQDAISYARRFLSMEVTSWSKQGGAKLLGIGTSKRKDELRHAIESLESVLNNLADLVPFIEAARNYWLPAVKRALQATEEHGHSADSFSPHRRLIQQTVNTVRQRYGYRRSRSPATKGKRQSACSIIAKALELNGLKPKNEEAVRRICSPEKKSRNRASGQSQS
jgi:hypothetical protein